MAECSTTTTKIRSNTFLFREYRWSKTLPSQSMKAIRFWLITTEQVCHYSKLSLMQIQLTQLMPSSSLESCKSYSKQWKFPMLRLIKDNWELMSMFLSLERRTRVSVLRLRMYLEPKMSNVLSSMSSDAILAFSHRANSLLQRLEDSMLILAQQSPSERRRKSLIIGSSRIQIFLRLTSQMIVSPACTALLEKSHLKWKRDSAINLVWMFQMLRPSSRIHGVSNFSQDWSGPSKSTQRLYLNGFTSISMEIVKRKSLTSNM